MRHMILAGNVSISMMVAALVSSIVLTGVDATTVADQVKPPRVDYTSGVYLYRTFCASCHGESAKGDGPVAALLSTRPPDLTAIAARAGGRFPRTEVSTAIDGRRGVRGHGSAEMPVWGDVLKVTEGHDDAIVKRRIDALVMHLESLQVK